MGPEFVDSPDERVGARFEKGVFVQVHEADTGTNRFICTVSADGVGGVTIIRTDLTEDTVRNLYGKDGVATSSHVFGMIEDAVRDYGYDGLYGTEESMFPEVDL